MSNEKLEQTITALEEIDQDAFKLKIDRPLAPDLAKRMIDVKDKLNALCAVIGGILEGDYRTAPVRNHSETTSALVPVSQAAQSQDLTKHEFAPQEKEQLSARKLQILNGIKHPGFRRMLKQKLDKVSVKSLNLLRKIDPILSAYSNYPLNNYLRMPNLLDGLVKVVGILIDKISQNHPDGLLDRRIRISVDLQYEELKPYIDYLSSEFKMTRSKMRKASNENQFFNIKIADLESLDRLFTKCPPELFSIRCKGHDMLTSGFFSSSVPMPVFLAGNKPFSESCNGHLDRYNDGLSAILPKFPQMKNWAAISIKGEERRRQLQSLLNSLSFEQLEYLEPESCDDFLTFMNKKNAADYFATLSASEKTAFILDRQYSFASIIKIITAGT